MLCLVPELVAPWNAGWDFGDWRLGRLQEDSVSGVGHREEWVAESGASGGGDWGVGIVGCPKGWDVG